MSLSTAPDKKPQPCPDCGTLMNAFCTPALSLEITHFDCPGCGQRWTPEQILLVYRLMEIANQKEDLK